MFCSLMNTKITYKEIKKLVWMYRETSTGEIAMIVAC